jgi:hypothetical protein
VEGDPRWGMEDHSGDIMSQGSIWYYDQPEGQVQGRADCDRSMGLGLTLRRKQS